MVDLPDARSLSPEALELLRKIAVRAVIDFERTQKETAELLGLGRNVVGQWCAAYRSEGEAAFAVGRQGRPVGTGRFLTPTEEIIVQAIVCDGTPEQFGIASSRWTRRTVAELIRRRFDLDLSLQGVGNYLHRWNMTPQKPARRAREQDPEEVREFEEETLPETLEKADEEDAELHFADEVGAAVADQIGTSHARKGRTPVLEFPKTRIKQNLISSVTPEGGVTYYLFPGTLTAEKFIGYLEHLVASSSGKVFLLIDRHPAHTAQKVEAWIAAHADRMEVVWLPRYSPEYNPDEFLNNDLKQNLKTKPLPDSTPAFAGTILGILDQIANAGERVQGYFRQSKLAMAPR